jgi:hypothetical protein
VEVEVLEVQQDMDHAAQVMVLQLRAAAELMPAAMHMLTEAMAAETMPEAEMVVLGGVAADILKILLDMAAALADILVHQEQREEQEQQVL